MWLLCEGARRGDTVLAAGIRERLVDNLILRRSSYEHVEMGSGWRSRHKEQDEVCFQIRSEYREQVH